MSARDDYSSLVYFEHEGEGWWEARDQIDTVMAEIDSLRRWKAEATEVINGWDRVWEECGKPGPLGGIKSDNVLRVLKEAVL